MKVGRRKARRKRAKLPKRGQLPLWKPRGGKRRRAGRKPKGPRAGSPHKVRPELKARHPVHVVLRTVDAVRSLRRRHTYQAIRWATLTTARREDFRIVHVSIQRTHLHLLVEADSKSALSVGMQGFQISAAKHLNREISRGRPGPRRRGGVFPDRYHAEIIHHATQARHTLAYVLINRKHQEDRRSPMREWKVDWFSSAAMFPGWAEYAGEPEEQRHFLWKGPDTYDPLIVYQPRTWLLREGWKKAGPISKDEVPSARR